MMLPVHLPDFIWIPAASIEALGGVSSIVVFRKRFSCQRDGIAGTVHLCVGRQQLLCLPQPPCRLLRKLLIAAANQKSGRQKENAPSFPGALAVVSLPFMYGFYHMPCANRPGRTE
ncbi:MAG: hypothetical protein HDT27_04210 [Subdoligranulum sp.]|nr:hypothetical protein [Subdoligranulum sp.]